MLLSKNKEYSDMCYRIESKPVRERPKKKDKEEEEEKKRRKNVHAQEQYRSMQRKELSNFHSLRGLRLTSTCGGKSGEDRSSCCYGRL
jgi:hypothetical protein